LWVSPHRSGKPTPESNLYLDGLNPAILVTIDGSAALYHFDSGASSSQLGVDFCVAHSHLIDGSRRIADTVSGAGGFKEYPAYRLTHLPLSIGGETTTLDRVDVFARETGAPWEPFFGNLGQDITRAFNGFTIDFRAMTFRLGKRFE
jgi:hypothetical protein